MVIVCRLSCCRDSLSERNDDLSAAPNLAWTYNSIRTNRAYLDSPTKFYDTVRTQRTSPFEYTKLFRIAGRWIVDHTDSSAIVLTRWKELAIWLEGRKLLNVDRLTPVDAFESLLRDYEVRYVVSLVALERAA